MKAHAKWVGNGWGYPQRWQTKHDIPQLNPGERAIYLEFRFECAWSIMNHEGRILFKTLDGEKQWVDVWDLHLNDFGRVIGPKDFSAADHTPMAEAWRGATAQRRAEEFDAWKSAKA